MSVYVHRQTADVMLLCATMTVKIDTHRSPKCADISLCTNAGLIATTRILYSAASNAPILVNISTAALDAWYNELPCEKFLRTQLDTALLRLIITPLSFSVLYLPMAGS